MKAVGVSKYGPVDNLQSREVPKPSVQSADRFSVKACSVNPIDHKVRSGTYDDAPGISTRSRHADYGLTFMTAYQSLYRRMEVKPEEQAGILIINSGGGVGTTASRPETIDSCKRMGATHVINHREDPVKQIEDLDLDVPIKYVYIVARTEQYTESVAKICAPFGKVCTIVQADVSLYGTEFMSKSLTFSWDWLGSAAYHNTGVEDHHEMLDTISRLMEDGTLFSTVGTRLRLTLEGLKEAHKRVESSTTVGKIALGVDEPGEGEPFA
ncbi:hypothetical protein FOC4_g10003323 [Fusarium odoratissimum]|uniref:Enoyl reductase (ER) domain-containing protein n=1 Tax=Fusarium oxysporum f. sp. cubense (strain race 4) TaxID=2502994 RepID=N1RVZ2_FUSC4|nr:hypothetical protein FOC4_g10003323 [Fusarium odoratissimum]